MILITGGVFQGKLEFAKALAGLLEEPQPWKLLEGENLTADSAKKAEIIYNFHHYIRSLLEQGIEPWPQVKQLLEENPKVILTMAEQGCGIVPITAFERRYRETVGRIGCELAKEAEAVYRVNCGIGTKIKS